MFEGLINILPDEDKRREMLVLLAASRSVKAKAEAKVKVKATQKTKPKPAGNNNNNNSQPSGGMTANVPQRSKASSNPTKSPTPGSAATYLTAMGSKTSSKSGGTGISVVRPSRAGSSRKANANVNGNPRQRSESPPPGVLLQRHGSDEMGYGGGGGGGNNSIAGAGASWATQGGSGFRGNSTGRGAGSKGVTVTTNSRDDFPGLVGNRTGGGGGGGRMASSYANGLAVARGAGPAPANPRTQQQRAPVSEDFPGLPTPSASVPGMGRVDWGTASSGGRIGGQTSRNSNTFNSVEDGVGNDEASNNNTSSGGKGGKKKARQKAEKGALKGMAFGFR